MLVATSILGFAVVCLLIAVLGVMRELVLTRAELNSLANLVVNPPLAAPLQRKWSSTALASLELATTPSAIMFVSQGCPGCSELLRKLHELSEGNPLGGSVAILARGAGRRALQNWSRVAETALIDSDGTLFRDFRISVTPITLLVNEDEVVADFKLGSDVTWIRDKFQPLI